MTALAVSAAPTRLGDRVRWLLYGSAFLLVGFFVFLLARSAGSDYMPIDDWGTAAFELVMGGICIARYFDAGWRSSRTVAAKFPLVLGAGCVSWAVGDFALTAQSIGGANPPTPSVADGFYVLFFPLCFLAFTMVIRRGNSGSLVATSLDGLIAGLAAAAISAAYIFKSVVHQNNGDTMAAATNLFYPVGDFLLLALAIGGLTILPKRYRRFLVIASLAMVANAVGDLYNLLDTNSKVGWMSDALAWPISLFLLAVATWAQPASTLDRRVSAGNVNTERTAGFALPTLGGIASLVVLVWASLGHTDRAAVGLATGTLLVAGVRVGLTVREARALTSSRFRSLIDNAWDLIVVAEADLQIAYVTPSSDRVLGYRPDDMRGGSITATIHPDDVGEMIEQLHKLPDTRTAVFETRMRHRDGAWRMMAWSATNLLSDPSIRGYVLNGSDVTQTRQAAEDLAAARDAALMASRAKSDFLSTMSHEIRTPMNGVIGLTELLLSTPLDPEQHELASGVKVSAENLLHIINDILDFSKIEAGKLDIEAAPFSLTGLADDVGRILATAAHSKDLELLVDVHPDVPAALMGDAVRIQQVLLNLGSNAIKFTSTGEVLIRVSVLHENNDRMALRFSVTDTGIGIAASDQERMFRAFAQADSSTTRQYGGTGLGLAICRQLVELMGGQLGLDSAPGEGSTFWFDLSLARVQNLEIPRADASVASLVGRRTLIVDDNATNRKILGQQLVSWGVEPVEAVDGYQAVELAIAAAHAGRPFELGIVDLNMPGMDGVGLAAALKSDPATKAMALFLLSSSGERLSESETHLRGFVASMTKPVRSSELFDCLITNLGAHLQSVPEPEPTRDPLAHRGISGMILLVEDNAMNQLVGCKVLTKLGYCVDVANHGGEAVSAVRSKSYDAILMDCQMPEMDGYEATAEIRRLEGDARHTPIIAMTAAAMDGDREACLVAGMDDYITKPVRPEVVAEALEKWIPRRAHGGNGANGANGANGKVAKANGVHLETLDLAQIEVLRGLDDGQGAVLAEIVDQYLTQTIESRGELLRVVEAGDDVAARRAAHALKGASATVGAAALAAVCEQIENGGSAAELVSRFDHEFDRAREALRQVVET